MHDKQAAEPDYTAVRVALWRALHLEVDSPPHLFEDDIGLKLAAPDEGWRRRPELASRRSCGSCQRYALAQRYFEGRIDGLRPPNNSEELLVATV